MYIVYGELSFIEEPLHHKNRSYGMKELGEDLIIIRATRFNWQNSLTKALHDELAQYILSVRLKSYGHAYLLRKF